MRVEKLKAVVRAWISALRLMMDDEEFKAFIKSLVEENVV